jgi:hypothetical protein
LVGAPRSLFAESLGGGYWSADTIAMTDLPHHRVGTATAVVSALVVLTTSGSPQVHGQARQQTCDANAIGAYRNLTAFPIVREVAPYVASADTSDLARKALTVPTRHGLRVVATLSWGGPNNGMLLLLSCDGRLLAAEVPGYALSLRLRDVDGDGYRELVLNHQTGSGTGWRQECTSIFRVVGDSLQSVWSAVTFEGNYQGAGFTGTWEIRGSVTFPAVGRLRLSVDSGAVDFDASGRRTHFLSPPIRVTSDFRWARATSSFQRVGTARPPSN